MHMAHLTLICNFVHFLKEGCVGFHHIAATLSRDVPATYLDDENTQIFVKLHDTSQGEAEDDSTLLP